MQHNQPNIHPALKSVNEKSQSLMGGKLFSFRRIVFEWLKLRTKFCQKPQCNDIVNARFSKRKGRIQNPHENLVKELLVYINGNRLVKEEPVSKNSRKVSGIETTYGSKML